MASFLQIEKLTKSVGTRILFSDATLNINEGDKIGVVARNGAGKSTLLRILAGEETADSGKIVQKRNLQIGYLPQTPTFDNAKSLIENVAHYTNTESRQSSEDAARRMLDKLGLRDLSLDIAKMSGGEIKRAAIAKVILSEPDMLILDEPTNHLDIGVVEWLEKYLSKQRTTLLVVSHDRYFLDAICSRIIEIDDLYLYAYDGNFDYYLEKRAERHENQSAEVARVRNLLRTELDWMRRQPQARGSKAKYRIDNFYDLQERSRQRREERNVALEVESQRIGKKIFEASHISKAYGDKVILNDWSYVFAKGEKVGIVGANGVGKTTLLRMLLGFEKPDSGFFDVGETVRWGYYSQTGMTDFNPEKKVIDAVRDIAEEVRINDSTRLSVSQFLSQFLFSYERQNGYISKLSGGERRRLYLATVLMQSPNFLILDEPTNDLDIATLTVLEDYLLNFKGCVIIVSHDRFFLDRISDHMFVLEGDGNVKDFPGNYSEYRHYLDVKAKETSEATPKKVEAKTERLHSRKATLSFKEKKEKEELEKRLDYILTRRKELETKMSEGNMPHEELTSCAKEIESLMTETDDVEMRLLELMEKEEG